MPKTPSRILITGASGRLGRALTQKSLWGRATLLTPSRCELDICSERSVQKYFQTHQFDAILHAAAIARMNQAHADTRLAIRTNIIGTSFLVAETMAQERRLEKTLRFVYISTDGVYPSQKGPYSENSPTIPYNHYGWSKLGGECAVRLLANHCIVRTRFFDPTHIPFDSYPIDSWSSALPVDELAKAIQTLVWSDLVGVINVGGGKKNDFTLFRPFKPTLKPCSLKDIQKNLPYRLSKDASLDCRRWKTLKTDA